MRSPWIRVLSLYAHPGTPYGNFTPCVPNPRSPAPTPTPQANHASPSHIIRLQKVAVRRLQNGMLPWSQTSAKVARPGNRLLHHNERRSSRNRATYMRPSVRTQQRELVLGQHRVGARVLGQHSASKRRRYYCTLRSNASCERITLNCPSSGRPSFCWSPTASHD